MQKEAAAASVVYSFRINVGKLTSKHGEGS